MNNGVFVPGEAVGFVNYRQEGLPSVALQDAWRDQLRDIEQAENWEVLSVKHYHATCWLAALVQARLISLPTAVELRETRDMAHQIAGDRLVSNTP